MPRANHAAVAIWPAAIARGARETRAERRRGARRTRSAAIDAAPVHVHAAIGATPSPWPMCTPSAALEAAKNGKAQRASRRTRARCSRRLRGDVHDVEQRVRQRGESDREHRTDEEILVVVAAVATRRVGAAAAAAGGEARARF